MGWQKVTGEQVDLQFDRIYQNVGSHQYTVPSEASQIHVYLGGAEGGNYFSKAGGHGGEVGAKFNADELPRTLEVRVGEEGQDSRSTNDAGDLEGGFNGGGHAREPSFYTGAGSGGGATDIRTGSSLNDRILVAGGGGGACEGATGGDGGGNQGEAGGGEYGGGGGTQSAGGSASDPATDGSFGQGGNDGYYESGTWERTGGGGGGGYYGGAGGKSRHDYGEFGGGGGGSNYAEGEVITNTQGTNAGHGYALFFYTT